MNDLEKEAKKHINKAEQTVKFLRDTRLADPQLTQYKKDFIHQDIVALEFLIEYAKEALVNRGIRV